MNNNNLTSPNNNNLWNSNDDNFNLTDSYYNKAQLKSSYSKTNDVVLKICENSERTNINKVKGYSFSIKNISIPLIENNNSIDNNIDLNTTNNYWIIIRIIIWM